MQNNHYLLTGLSIFKPYYKSFLFPLSAKKFYTKFPLSQTQLRLQVVVLLFRRLIAGISSFRPGFNPRPFYVAWVECKVAVPQVFVAVLFFPLSGIFHKFNFIIHTTITNIIIV